MALKSERRLILHRGIPGGLKCGMAPVGLLPYVRGGMESNWVWDSAKVTCKRCMAHLERERQRRIHGD